MKIIYDTQIFQLQRRGGVTRYFCELFREFRATGLVEAEVVLGVHQTDHFHEIRSVSKVLGPTLYLKPLRHTFRIRTKLNQWFTELQLRRSAADLYHPTYNWTPAHPLRQRIVYTVYDLAHERFPSLFGTNDPAVAWRRQSLSRAEVIFAISEHTKHDLMDVYNIPSSKILVTPLGNPLRATNPTSTNYSKPYLLFVGRRDYYKNYGVVQAAFRKEPLLATEFDLVCFGGGPLLESEVDPAVPARYLDGNDSVLAGLYRDAFALVYPSRYEGFGLPLLEAMSQDCPVITTRCGSLPEVGGDAVTYFSPDSPDELLAAIASLKSSTRRVDTIQKGREQESRFSWARCAQQTAAGYQRALN